MSEPTGLPPFGPGTDKKQMYERDDWLCRPKWAISVVVERNGLREMNRLY
jgi:hypothetical protein